MDLTYQQIQRVFELQQKLFAIKSFITGIKQLMEQLMNDKCDCHFTFRSHNLDQHLRNEALQKTTFQGIESFIINGPQPTPGTKPCHNELLFSFTDIESLTLLQSVIELKEKTAAHLQQQIENILIPNLKIELTTIHENPIQHLHDGQ